MSNSNTNPDLEKHLGLLASCVNTIRVLTVLAERTASPKEIAKILGISTPTASHHAKKLVEMELVELVEEVEVGGAIQHMYRAVFRPVVSTKEWEKLSLKQREEISVWGVRLILADAAIAFSEKVFDRSPKRHLSRAPLRVDLQGFHEIARIQDRALAELLRVYAAIEKRLEESGDAGFYIVAAMMCFQVPGPRERLASPGDLDALAIPDVGEADPSD